MNIIQQFINLVLHLDKYLGQIIQDYGTLTYLFLFLVIFMETGFVITFPTRRFTDFAAGTLAGLGYLNVWVLYIVLCAAAILGDTVNYWIGHYIGPRAFSGNIRFLKRNILTGRMRSTKNMVV
jgi:membrane-associated protein